MHMFFDSSTRLITHKKPPHSHAKKCVCKLPHKKNVVLYLDAELVKKTRELGFNLSKTFENLLKQLINNFQSIHSQNMCGKCGSESSPGYVTYLV